MKLVADSGPLIALAKVGRIDLLGLFSQVLIPPAVESEILAKPGPDGEILRQALTKSLKVTAQPTLSAEVLEKLPKLDPGEREAIALAHEEGCLLLLDDRIGRRAARRLGVAVTGVAGLLLTAKQRGLIPAVLPLLQEIRDHGYWLSDELLTEVGKLAAEL